MRYDYTVFDLRVREIPPPGESRRWMEETLRKINATVLGYLSKDFESPAGHAYTQLWVLAESHAVIHTSPEEGWTEVVFAFCKKIEQPPLTQAIRDFWKPLAMNIQTMTGVVPGRGWKKGPKVGVSGLGEAPWKYDPTQDEKLIYRTRSPYQEIMLTQLPDKEVALYLDGGIQFVSGYDDMVYHWTLGTAPALMHGSPRNALILGGGDGLLARNLFELPSIRKVTMIEIDPVITEVSRKHPILSSLNKRSFEDPRMDLRIMDARKFAASTPKEKYDLILVDFTDPLDSSMADLYSTPFYRAIYDHGSSSAVMAVQSSSAFSDVEDRVTAALLRATGSIPKPLRFSGSWMADGTIVTAGRGVDPLFKMPSGYEADPPKKKPLEYLYNERPDIQEPIF